MTHEIVMEIIETEYQRFWENFDYPKNLEKQCTIHRSAEGKIVIEINVTIPIDIVNLTMNYEIATHKDVPDYSTSRVGILHMEKILQEIAEMWAKEYRRMKYSQLDYGFEKVFSKRENRYGSDYFYECVVIL
jgi:hypothetical protein